ncbi:MAG: protein-tyrosine phosphatase family protein [Brevefilum sp.]
MKSELLTELPYGLKGEVYRSPLPHSPLFDPDRRLLGIFAEAGVDVIVMLTPEEEVRDVTGKNPKQLYDGFGFEVIYAPVEDFSIPEQGAFQRPLQRVLNAAQSGQTVVIHCHAGLGRTGMFAACLAKIVLSLSGEEAVQWIRQYVPEAVQTVQQYRFVENFVYQPEGV